MRISVLAAGAALLLVTGCGLFEGGAPGPDADAARPQAVRAGDPPKTRPLAGSPPASLTLPKIGLRTPVSQIALNTDGTLAQAPAEPGWYRLGPTPGQLGPAVIAGNAAAEGDAFYKLGEVTPGDEVEVVREDGSRAVFKVDSVEKFPKKQVPTQRVFGELRHPGLRLLTYGEEMIVVFAHLAATRPPAA
ncbi:sortase domain-bontaining protein [Bailinhaonella thermotolerans]|nr:class F sortase [Bailinhaonella thermotolerans]